MELREIGIDAETDAPLWALTACPIPPGLDGRVGEQGSEEALAIGLLRLGACRVENRQGGLFGEPRAELLPLIERQLDPVAVCFFLDVARDDPDLEVGVEHGNELRRWWDHLLRRFFASVSQSSVEKSSSVSSSSMSTGSPGFV